MMDMARELFEAMPCPNISSWNTMITGYAQNGDIALARHLFNQMPRRDSISWAAMIAGYAQSAQSEEALNLFVDMKRDGERINRSTFTCVLSTCADIAALELGTQLHGRAFKAGFESGCFVGNALLAMYCKCGSIDEAYDVFEDITDKDVVSWNTILAGYARHGFGKKALNIFDSMKVAGVKPDEVTMVGVLSAFALFVGVSDGLQRGNISKLRLSPPSQPLHSVIFGIWAHHSVQISCHSVTLLVGISDGLQRGNISKLR
ncbi:hypothetical protein ACET3Z_014987 [Daucus carota]